MDDTRLEAYWADIPFGQENAVTYGYLILRWKRCEREVRKILHKLSAYDNGDGYVLVRSGKNKGFYRSNDPETLKAYRQECLNKGKSVFAPVKKINKILAEDAMQFSMENNLRNYRENAGLKQREVCAQMQVFENSFDNTLLSKMENGVCLPTMKQIILLSKIYNCNPEELIKCDYHLL